MEFNFVRYFRRTKQRVIQRKHILHFPALPAKVHVHRLKGDNQNGHIPHIDKFHFIGVLHHTQEYMQATSIMLKRHLKQLK